MMRRIGRPPIGLSLRADDEFLMGVNIGVSETQIGATTVGGELLSEDAFATPKDPVEALARIRLSIDVMRAKISERALMIIGVSVSGPTDVERGRLLYAPHLGWRDVAIASMLRTNVPVVVENNATAAAIYEAQRRRGIRNVKSAATDFALVRAGTGIGVGLVLGGEVYRGARGVDLAGEFGHMTIVAGGRGCPCGNRGCWERYASAASAVELYLGHGARAKDRSSLRFRDIVARAEAGELRARATLEKVGQSLGVGIGNIICGLGVPQVVVSGRILRGWKFIQKPLREVVGRTMAGRLADWSIEPGDMSGSSLGGAIEVAIESYLLNLRLEARSCA
jgi:predicted NBD/HSP70 family sugar kinase